MQWGRWGTQAGRCAAPCCAPPMLPRPAAARVRSAWRSVGSLQRVSMRAAYVEHGAGGGGRSGVGSLLDYGASSTGEGRGLGILGAWLSWLGSARG
jgi:hypothetical protein